MTLEETGKLLATMQQYWNMAAGKDPRAMAKAWHLSLSDIDYRMAVYAVADLSKTNKFAPTVCEIREKVEPMMRKASGTDWIAQGTRHTVEKLHALGAKKLLEGKR